MNAKTKRSQAMLEVAYSLARFGERAPGKSSKPPRELNASSWQDAYGKFYSVMGQGRTQKSFAGSMNAARSVYDYHFPNGRAGWRSAGSTEPLAILPPAHQRVWDTWVGHERSELWRAIKGNISGRPDESDEFPRADAEVQLGEQDTRTVRTEGGETVQISAHAERDSNLRDVALRIHGSKCAVCGWDAEQVYGAWGVGYAEVHHLVPLEERPGIRETNPEFDLAVLCANCHRMIHRKRDMALQIDELQAKLDISGIRAWAASFD